MSCKRKDKGISNLKFTFLQVHLLCQHFLTVSLCGLYVTKSISSLLIQKMQIALRYEHSILVEAWLPWGGLPKSLMSRFFSLLHQLQVRKVLAGTQKDAIDPSLLQPWGRWLQRTGSKGKLQVLEPLHFVRLLSMCLRSHSISSVSPNMLHHVFTFKMQQDKVLSPRSLGRGWKLWLLPLPH